MKNKTLLNRIRKAIGEKDSKQFEQVGHDITVVPESTPFEIDSLVMTYGIYEFFKSAQEQRSNTDAQALAEEYWSTYDFKKDDLCFKAKVPTLYNARLYLDEVELESDEEVKKSFGDADVPFQCKYIFKSGNFATPLASVNEKLLGENAPSMPTHILGNFRCYGAGKMSLVSDLTKDFGENPIIEYVALYKKFAGFCGDGWNEQRDVIGPTLESFLDDKNNLTDLRKYALLHALCSKAIGLQAYKEVKKSINLEEFHRNSGSFRQSPKYVRSKDEIQASHPEITATPEFILKITESAINYADRCISELKK